MLKSLVKSKVFSNSLYLYILQIFNTILPLLILPYITRVLGIEQYGVFSKMLNYITYFQAFIEYGFTLAGAKQISLAKDQESINKIYSCIIVCKLILCVLSLFVVGVLSFVVFISNNQWKCLLVLSLILLSEVFMQTWLFQGLQDMKFIMLISVVSRTISTVLIFLLVKGSWDLILYSVLYSSTNLIVALFGTLIIKFKFKVKFFRVSFNDCVKEFKEGFPLFTTSFASRICTGIAVTVLSILSDDVNIGGYSAIQKIPYIIVMMFMPIGQALYPHMCKLYQYDAKKGVRLIKKILLVVLFCVITLSALFILLRNLMVKIVYGQEYINFSSLIIPLCGWLCLSIVNNILGVQILVARGFQKQYSVVFVISICVLILSNFGLGYLWESMGVAIATMFSELIICLGCLIVIFKYKLLK